MQEDETTTSTQPVDEGAQEALPEQQEQQEADSSETSQSTNEGADNALPETDDKLKSFAKGQGIEDLSELSDREQKLLKVAYDNNANFQRNRQKASQLEKNLTTASDEYAEQVAEQTGQDPQLLQRLQRVEVKETVRDFFDRNPEAREREADMIEVLRERPHLVSDLDAAYAVLQTRNIDQVKSEGKKEALKSLASNQQAAVPKGNAVNQTATSSSAITPDNVDDMVAKMTVQEYQKRLPEINAALARR